MQLAVRREIKLSLVKRSRNVVASPGQNCVIPKTTIKISGSFNPVSPYPIKSTSHHPAHNGYD